MAVSGFRKEISKFFTAVRVPATQALLDQYGLPEDLLTETMKSSHARIPPMMP